MKISESGLTSGTRPGCGRLLRRGCGLVLLIAVCLLALGGAGWYVGQLAAPTAVTEAPTRPRPTVTLRPVLALSTRPPTQDNVSQRKAAPRPTTTSLPIAPDANVVQEPVSAAAVESLERLMAADYPPHDYFETAVRLGGYSLSERTISVDPYQVGDRRLFYTDAGEVRARLVAQTAHTYFWIEEGLAVDESAVTAAAHKLETEYYPRLTGLFGAEWRPGVDGDPHFSVLHVRLDSDTLELGYFSDVDEYPQALYPESNQQEIVYLNMSQLKVGEPLYEGTLVHELQHLIQWRVDPNESAWLDEGLSQLAELYVGLETADTAAYLRHPHIRLNSWDYDERIIDAYYAGAYLFAVYLWEQWGETAVRELARHPANGMAAVESVRRGYDPERNLARLMADWATANYLDDPAAGPAYHYRHLDPPRPATAVTISTFPFVQSDTLNQFGVHYLELDAGSAVTLTFAGDTITSLLPPPPAGDAPIWLAPAMNEMGASLTAPLDLRRVSAATLAFNAWYDLETDWDFAYVAVSPDGEKWTVLEPNHGGWGEYGRAFNGRSGDAASTGWVRERISLDQYAGQQIWIRFEVLTDAAITGQGFAVSGVRVPEVAETAVGPWQAAGFVAVDTPLPQQWALQLVENGSSPRVRPLPLNDFNQGRWRLDLGEEGGTLIVIPLTPFTDQMARYWVEVLPAP